MNKTFKAVCLAPMLLSNYPLQANEAAIRIDGDEKKTVGEFTGIGTVCVEIKHDDGSDGRVKMWTLGVNESSKHMETGSACFNISGYTKIRAGFTDGGGVTIKIIKEDLRQISIPIPTVRPGGRPIL